ncbi:MAG: hypothetical protein U0L20_06410 [Ruminococcus sp.]|nr:hypothetical protein [Ruminococcus sp.]
MKIILIIFSLMALWINIDNFRIKRKITQLYSKVERLSEIANIECNLPKDELPDEVKINYLENHLDSLESVILNQNGQE